MREGLAADLDETIMPLVEHVLHDWNAARGTSIKMEDFHCYEWYRFFGISNEETYAMYHEWTAQKVKQFPEKGLGRSFFDGALETLAALSKQYDLHVITDRSTHVEAETRLICSLIQSEGSCLIPEERIHETPKYGMNKADLCERLGITKIIDDSVTVAQTCSEKGIHVYLMRKPWNKGIAQGEYITPVNGWSDVAKHLL